MVAEALALCASEGPFVATGTQGAHTLSAAEHNETVQGLWIQNENERHMGRENRGTDTEGEPQ